MITSICLLPAIIIGLTKSCFQREGTCTAVRNLLIGNIMIRTDTGKLALVMHIENSSSPDAVLMNDIDITIFLLPSSLPQQTFQNTNRSYVAR